MMKRKTTVMMVRAEKRKMRPAKSGLDMGRMYSASEGIMLDMLSMYPRLQPTLVPFTCTPAREGWTIREE